MKLMVTKVSVLFVQACKVLICATVALNLSLSCLADECLPANSTASTAVGKRCTEDPSCVIVGYTHMLEWKSPSPAGIVVVCIHGLGLCARAYKPLAQELSASGIDGFGVNVRGFGPDRDIPNRAKLNCIETVADVRNLLVNIRKEHPDYKVFLIGESMGGALAVRIAAGNNELVDGVICSAPAWRLLKTRKTAIKGIFELILFSGSSPGPAGRGVMRQATADPKLIEHWRTDPSHKLRLSLLEATAFQSFISKTDKFAKKLSTPVLIIQGLNDHLVSLESVAKIYRDIPATNKTFLIDGQGEHLVLEEGRASPELVQKLVAWLKTGVHAQSRTVGLEAINDTALSAKEQQRLTQLRELIRTD